MRTPWRRTHYPILLPFVEYILTLPQMRVVRGESSGSPLAGVPAAVSGLIRPAPASVQGYHDPCDRHITL